MAAPPHTRNELRRARVYEANSLAYSRLKAKAMGGWVLRDDEVEVMAGPWVGAMNGLFPPWWDTDDCEERLHRAIRLYKQTGQGMMIITGPSSNADALRPLLLDLGFRCSYWVPYMHLDADNLAGEHSFPKDISFERVADFSLFDDHPHPWIGPRTTERRRRQLTFAESLCKGSRPKAWQFVARRGDEVVGCALIYRNRRNAGVYDVHVLEKCRRQGIGSGVMAHACGFAREQGIREIGLGASGRGVGLYEKVGFTLAGRYGCYWLGKNRVTRLKV